MEQSFETIKASLEEGILHAQLNRGKVNAINSQMARELIAVINYAKTQEDVRALILTGYPGCFTAGLDLKSLLALDEDGVEQFWRYFHQVILQLVSLDKPVATSISGHSPAGGCVLAICSDFRFMAEGKYLIGLNELAVGIPVPALIYELMAVWVGRRNAYQNLMTSKMLNPSEALKQGLVDGVVPLDELQTTVRLHLSQVLKLPSKQWSMSKRNFRRHLEPVLTMTFEDVFSQALQNWWDPETRSTLEAVVASFGKK
tara:strand:- start:2529 stop:3302 length:774 start_codon:yes stop_codon:yes gene_type:complete